MTETLNTSNVAARTAAAIPDVVKNAFEGATLTMGDVLRLERAGCRFIAESRLPSVSEFTAVYWLLKDREAFCVALNSGGFNVALQKYADGLEPAELFGAADAIKDVLSRSFEPVAGAGKMTPTTV